MGPNCLKKLFTFKKEILNRSLRYSSSTNTFVQAKYKQYEKEFHKDGASIWNSLPKDIGESNYQVLKEKSLPIYSL